MEESDSKKKYKARAKFPFLVLVFLTLVIIYKWSNNWLLLENYSDTSSKKTKLAEISYVNNQLPRKTITIQTTEEKIYANKFYIPSENYITYDSYHNNDEYKSSNTINLDQEGNNGLNAFSQNAINVDGQSITFGSIPVDNEMPDENLKAITPSSYDNGQLIAYGPLAVNDDPPEKHMEMIGQPYDSGQSITFGSAPINDILTEENTEAINPTY